MRKICSIAVMASLVGCASAPSGIESDPARKPASSRALLDCAQYESAEEKKLCALSARQILEGMGYFVESGILRARREYVFRATIPLPKTRYDVGPVAVMAGLFSAGGASAMAGTAASAYRPGSLVNRLLESIAVTPIGVPGASLLVSSSGGASAVSAATYGSRPKVREGDTNSSAQGSLNFQLIFRKKHVTDVWAEETEKDRLAAETKFRAEIGKTVQDLVDRLSLLYLDDEQSEAVAKAAKDRILDGFKGSGGKFDDRKEVQLDIIAILHSLGGDIAKKLDLLDGLIGKTSTSNPDPQTGSGLKVAVLSTYSMLEGDLVDLAETYEEREVDPKHGGPSAGAFLADEAAYVKNLQSFIARVKTTRKLLAE